jgi:TetR/AcrR family transcriptional regulator, regulator of cefoperazone and chloramphenicol sensitivity
MLIMESARAGEEDRTARARIRDAAIDAFAERGATATSVKAIAAQAGVSPALVFHHFGSKEGLRATCDAYVLAVVDEQKRQALRAGPRLDVFGALRQEAEGPPVLRYLARMLADGSAEAAALVDGMVDVAVAAWEEGVRSGVFKPTEQPRDLNVVLVLWSLGLLVLHEHAERLLGVDITGDAGQRGPYVRVALEALRGLFTEEAYEHGLRTLAAAEHEKEGTDDRS